MSTAMAEREAEAVAHSLQPSIFCVYNMTSVGFLNSKEKSVTIDYSFFRPPDVSYFNFCSSINPHLFNSRASDANPLFDFSLGLPHSSRYSFVILQVPKPSIVVTPPSDDSFDDTLSRLLDVQLNQMTGVQMRDIISARCDTLPASGPSTTSRSFDSPTLTPLTTTTWSALLLPSSPLTPDRWIFWIIRPVSIIYLNIFLLYYLLLFDTFMRSKSPTLFDLILNSL